MPFSDATSQLEPLLFQMKQYKNLTKSTIEVLPSSGQQSYKPNQKCIFTLPYASTISLEDIALHFTFTPENIPKTATDDAECQRVLPPKDVASLISEIDIKINGQTIQHLTNYNDIVNLLNLFEDAKTAKKVLQGCDVTNTRVETAVGTVVKIENNTKYMTTANLNNKPKSYVINHWYGLLGHRGDEVSSNFLDTNMLGEVTIAFTFASASVLIGQAGSEANVRTATGNTGVTTITDLQITDAIKISTASYSLSDVKMSMVRYNLPVEFSEATRSNLNSGVKYQIAFNHYENHSMNALASSGSIRWNENSRDIKGLLAYFTSNERDSTNVPTLYSEEVESSVYFKYDNAIHDKSQFQVGSVKMPQNSLNTTDAFLELTRGIQGARGNNVEFFHKIKCVEDWAESYFMAYLSLEMSEGMTHLANGGKKLLSGLSSEQLPISCSYHYTNRTAPSAVTAAWKKNVNVMSLTTRMLVVESGQNCYVEI